MEPCFREKRKNTLSLIVNFKKSYFVANLRRSAFNCPGNRKQVVTPDIVMLTY
jgi:hypothetical protein